MSKNELSIINKSLPASKKGSGGPYVNVFVDYEKISDSEYRFNSKVDDDISIDIKSGNRNKNSNAYEDDVIDAEYAEQVHESEIPYYGIAMASGLLTGILSIHVSGEVINEVKNLDVQDKNSLKEWNKLLVIAANLNGYKGVDYKKALIYLLEHNYSKIIKHFHYELNNTVLIELSGQPTFSGLLFSILTQFSGKYYYLSKDNDIKTKNVPKDYVIGDDDAEKVILAILYWFFYACIEIVKKGENALEGLGIPKGITDQIIMVSRTIKISNIPRDYEQAEKLFNKWLLKMHKHMHDEELSFNILQVLTEKIGKLRNDLFPVLLNECIVRASYVLCKLGAELKRFKEINVEVLLEIDFKVIIPLENRILSNMELIASGAFAAANITPAIIKAIKKIKNNKGKEEILKEFISEVNVAGIGRFIIAFADNTKYFNENVHVIFNNLKWNKFNQHSYKTNNAGNYKFGQDMDGILQLMMLDEIQTRMLYSLENYVLEYDIANTKKMVNIDTKREWQRIWKKQVASLAGQEIDEYFIKRESSIYDMFYMPCTNLTNPAWIYVLIIELALFEPYYALDIEDDKKFKGLKDELDYVKNIFVRKQALITQEEVDKMRKCFKKYKSALSGTNKSLMIGVGSAGVATIALGAAAFTFAPHIAVALLGSQFASLHGAALTSATLAALGGGSLATGGLGMAGGTAIITGGGALAGLTGSSAITLAASLMTNSRDNLDSQYAKILTFFKCILKDKLGETDKVIMVKHKVSAIREMAEERLKIMKKEKTELDKEAIALYEEYVKYLGKFDAELNKI